MVKRRSIPSLRRVALRTICRPKCCSAGGVNGIVRLLPGRQVASRIPAICWLNRQVVISIDVAQRALHIRVAIRQQESGRAVIEYSVRPGCDGVASRASRCCRWEPGSYVIWNVPADGLRLVPVRRVAGHAIRRRQRVVVIDVAGGARGRRRRHVRAR